MHYLLKKIYKNNNHNEINNVDIISFLDSKIFKKNLNPQR